MKSMVEKLRMVKEAEGKAAHVLQVYQDMAEEEISRAREEAERERKLEEARAVEEGELEMERIIDHAREEAEELRREYMFDRARLLAETADRDKKAVQFLVDRLEELE